MNHKESGWLNMMKINTDTGLLTRIINDELEKGNLKSYARGSNIAKHASSSNHSIYFKNSKVFDAGSSCIRKTQES